MLEELRRKEQGLLQELAEWDSTPMVRDALKAKLDGFRLAVESIQHQEGTVEIEGRTVPVTFRPKFRWPIVGALLFASGLLLGYLVMPPKIKEVIVEKPVVQVVEVNKGLSANMEREISIAFGKLREMVKHDRMHDGATPAYILFKYLEKKLENPNEPWGDGERNVLNSIGTTGQRLVELDIKEHGE